MSTSNDKFKPFMKKLLQVIVFILGIYFLLSAVFDTLTVNYVLRNWNPTEGQLISQSIESQLGKVGIR